MTVRPYAAGSHGDRLREAQIRFEVAVAAHSKARRAANRAPTPATKKACAAAEAELALAARDLADMVGVVNRLET